MTRNGSYRSVVGTKVAPRDLAARNSCSEAAGYGVLGISASSTLHRSSCCPMYRRMVDRTINNLDIVSRLRVTFPLSSGDGIVGTWMSGNASMHWTRIRIIAGSGGGGHV